MKQVYLIRHALPDFPGGMRMCLGSTDIPLGPEGFSQARQMAASLPPVTRVFSSPLLRSVQTAQAIGMPVTVLADLRELHYGQWDGLTFQQIRLQYPDLYAARGIDPTLSPPEAEDPRLGCLRFCRAMAIAAQEAPGDFAVVAHGGVIAQFLQFITGVWKKPDYVEVIRLQYAEGSFSLAP